MTSYRDILEMTEEDRKNRISLYIDTNERFLAEWKWRSEFPDGLKKQGEELYQKGVGDIVVDGDHRGGSLSIRQFHLTASKLPSNYEECKNTPVRYNLHRLVKCDCAAVKKSRKCKHMYAFLRKWEDTVSSFKKEEPLKSYETRMEVAAKCRKESPLAPLFADLSEKGECYLQPWGVLSHYRAYAEPEDIQRAGEELAKEKDLAVPCSFGMETYFSRIHVIASMAVGKHKAKMTLSYGYMGTDEIETICTCNVRKSIFDDRLCWHQLVLLHRLWEYVLQENPTEETIRKKAQEKQMSDVVKNLSSLQTEEEASKEETSKEMVVAESIEENTPAPAKKKLCSLLPEISPQPRDMRLSFRLQLPGGKSYAIRNLPNFLHAYQYKEEFSISKTTSIDFSKESLDEDSLPYLRYIRINMVTMRRINQMIDSSHSFSYAHAHPASFGYTSYVPIDFETLDAFYELAEGKELAVDGTKTPFHVGGEVERLAYYVTTEKDTKGNTEKIELQIEPYELREGYVHSYLLTRTRLCRVTQKEMSVLQNLSKNHLDKMTIGKGQLEDWEKKILPALQNTSLLDLIMQ